MAYPKKEYPGILFGIIKSDKGFSLCSYLLNDEKRVKGSQLKRSEKIL